MAVTEAGGQQFAHAPVHPHGLFQPSLRCHGPIDRNLQLVGGMEVDGWNDGDMPAFPRRGFKLALWASELVRSTGLWTPSKSRGSRFIRARQRAAYRGLIGQSGFFEDTP